MTPEGAGLARGLLRRVAGRATTADRILDDLTEEWQERVAAAGRTGGATLWFWSQVLRAVPPLVRRRRERRRAAAGSASGGWAADVGSAARRLRRAPGFFVGSATLLALGIGANTALFSVLQAVVLAPLPYESPDRIHRAWAQSDARGIDRFSFRVAEHDRLRERAPFSAVGGEFAITVTLLPADGEPARVDARMVTPGFFGVFGVTPVLGRTFSDEDVEGGDRLLVVVSHEFWRDHLDGAPDALGRTVSIDERSYEVVGVLPAGYAHVSGPDVDLFLPHTVGTDGWIGRWLDLYVRLAPGADPRVAEADANSVLRAIAGEGDTRSRGWSATLEPLDTVVLGDVRPLLWLLFSAVGLLLLVACVSVAGLVLARSVARLDEVRIRYALGAGRGRLIRQLLVENLLLAAAGGVAGVGVARVVLNGLLATVPEEVPRLGDVSLDARVLAFAAVVAAGTGLVFGLAPAIRGTALSASGVSAHNPRGGVADRGTGRLLRALVITQVALTLVLTAGAGLLVRSVTNLHRRDLGFEGGPALTWRVALPPARYASAEAIDAFVQRYLSALREASGVTAAGASADLPLSGQGAVATVLSAADVGAGVEEGLAVLQRRASPGFFQALGVRVVAGRVFDGSEEPAGPPVVVISRSLAEALFPDEAAVGRRITFRRSPGDGDWLTVLGVVEDVQYTSADGAGRPQLYEALVQSPVRDLALVLRGDLPRSAALSVATGALREIDTAVPVHAVHSLDELRMRSLARRRFARSLFIAFAGLAMALTGGGLYGVLAFAVRRRSREIGVRMALGARGSKVVGRVVLDAAVLAALGIGLGLGLAWATRASLARLLYGVAPLDPGVLGGTVLLTLLLALVAAWTPARRAARIDPCRALRQD